MRALVLGLGFVVVAGGMATSVAALSLGDAAPSAAVKMKNVDGSEVSLAEIAGEKGLLVIFSCNHCPWVKAWEGRIAELGNSYRQQGIGVVAVNANDPDEYPEDGFEAMQQRSKDKGFEFPYVVDATSEVARSFAATKTPEAFLFDAAGKLVYHGAIDDNAREPEKVKSTYLRDALEALISGHPVPMAETKALGCSIKFR